MTWVLTTAISILLVELLVRLPFRSLFSTVGTITRKALHTLGAKSVSDHWKEKALLAYAGTLFASSMKLFGLLLIVGLIMTLSILVFDFIGYALGDFMLSWPGILFSSVVATTYFIMRKFFV
jgi:hypothetical protein